MDSIMVVYNETEKSENDSPLEAIWALKTKFKKWFTYFFSLPGEKIFFVGNSVQTE